MNISRSLKNDIRRLLRNHRYEKSGSGLYFPYAHVEATGYFTVNADGGAWRDEPNTTVYEGLDDLMACYFGGATAPVAFYVAPFLNNVPPSSALTAADFAATQGEYTGYTEGTRGVWKKNDAIADHKVSNSDVPVSFTVGATAATIRGCGFIGGSSVKGATGGKLVAAALFDVPNSLNPGSTFSAKYTFGLAPKA